MPFTQDILGPLCTVASITHLLFASAIAWQTERRAAHRFMHCTSAAALAGAVGYASLAYSTLGGEGLSYPAASLIMRGCFGVAAALIRVCCYCTLGLVACSSHGLACGRHLAVHGWTAAQVFTLLDMLSVSIIATGTWFWARPQLWEGRLDSLQSSTPLGCTLMLLGLTCQHILVAGFVALTVCVHWHGRKGVEGGSNSDAHQPFKGLYAVGVMMFVRGTFSLVAVGFAALGWGLPQDLSALAHEQSALFFCNALPLLACFGVYGENNPACPLAPCGAITATSAIRIPTLYQRLLEAGAGDDDADVAASAEKGALPAAAKEGGAYKYGSTAAQA